MRNGLSVIYLKWRFVGGSGCPSTAGW
jgi:hypothetical protein